MQFRQLLPLALASAISAQSSMSLTDALNSQNSTLSKLNSLLQSTGLTSQLNNLQNVTILAPSNDAVNLALNSSDSTALLANQGALTALLQYHILNGSYMLDSFQNTSEFIATDLNNQTYSNVTGGQRVECRRAANGNVTFFSALKQNATVVNGNITFSGGTIHIVDRVLSMPMNVTDTLTSANLTAAIGAVRKANLETTLGDTKDVTVFAPNNDAFNAIGSLIANMTNEQLTSLVGYHVVNGTVAYSTDLDNSTLTSLSGDDLTITVINGTVFVNAARVTVPDILFSNGVVHVINQVLNSANTTETPNPTATTVPPAFSGGSTGTGIPFTSGITTPTTTFPAATSGGSASSTSNPGVPMRTGAVGVAALFGGAAILVNI